MDPQRCTELADAAAERYGATVGLLQSLLAGAQDCAFTTQRADQLRSAGRSAADTYLRSEATLVDHALGDVAQIALRAAQTGFVDAGDAEPGFDLHTAVAQSADYLRTEVAAQLTRDVESLVNAYREFAVQTTLLARTKGVSLQTAIDAMGNRRASACFQYRDRRGRSYASAIFVRSAWRHALVCLSADAFVLEATSRGATTIQIEHPETNHPWNGRHFDLSDPSAFLALREEVFHPQTRVTMKVVA